MTVFAHVGGFPFEELFAAAASVGSGLVVVRTGIATRLAAISLPSALRTRSRDERVRKMSPRGGVHEPHPEYSVVQLRDLTDAAIDGGFSDTLEARFASALLGCTRTGLSLQRLKPGVRESSGHRHRNDEEIYVVVSGAGQAIVEGTVIELRPWDALRVSAASARAFAAGPDGLEFLAFGMHTDGDRGEVVGIDWPS